MMDTAGTVLIGIGTGLIVLSAVGLLRMPDLYLRISAAGKSSSLGVTLLLGGAALLLRDEGATLRVLLIAAFVVLTTPVASHIIGRAAYRSGVRLWKGSVVDEYGETGRGEMGRPGQGNGGSDGGEGEAFRSRGPAD